jgi:hypothetical protein
VGKPAAVVGQYEVEIDYFANVQQHTSEDWDQIYLSLSTSNPSHAPPVPALGSRGVYFQDNAPNMMFAKASGVAYGGRGRAGKNGINIFFRIRR